MRLGCESAQHLQTPPHRVVSGFGPAFISHVSSGDAAPRLSVERERHKCGTVAGSGCFFDAPAEMDL